MADGNRTTLVVAVAGIAATALVGLAGTTAAWLSARDDRAAQRELARDERTYDRRVSAYLDAIDFVERQRRAYELYSGYYEPLGEVARSDIPYQEKPPTRLTSRLRAFGSAQVFEEFQKTERLSLDMPVTTRYSKGRTFISATPLRPDFRRAYDALSAQIIRFQDAVHDEVG